MRGLIRNQEPEWGTRDYIYYWDKIHATGVIVYIFKIRHNEINIERDISAVQPSGWDAYKKKLFNTTGELTEEMEDWLSNDKSRRQIKKEKKMNKSDIILGNIYTTGYTGELYIPTDLGLQDEKLAGILIQDHSDLRWFYRYYNTSIEEEYNVLNEIDNSKKKLHNLIKNIKLFYLDSQKKIAFLDSLFPIEDLEIINITQIGDIPAHIIREYEKHKATIEAGSDIQVDNVILADIEPEITINTSGIDITSKYASIVSNVSEITKNINATTALDNHKEIAEAFIKAKAEISKLSVVKPNNFGFIGKWLKSNDFIKDKIEDVNEIRTRQQSTQENIDYLFGVVYKKYENLIVTGEGLQKSKLQMNKQIEALEELKLESNELISKYKTQSDIPIKDSVINTQIKTSIEKYNQRLTKVDGAIIATQTTITSLAKDLPAMKNDLTDEMAISSLLGSVDDYQVMYQEIAKLVSEVTTATADKTYVVIENLLQLQIEDTHTMKYLVDSGERAEKLAIMLTDKTGKLTKKVQRDAEFIADIAKGNSIEHARSKYKLLN